MSSDSQLCEISDDTVDAANLEIPEFLYRIDAHCKRR
jgi:hypothetical protein